MKTAIENLADHFPGSSPEEQLCEELPHGGGIDGTWHCTIYKNGNVEFCNGFHAMDENGYYDGWGDFRLVLFLHKKTVLHRLIGPCTGQFQIIHKRGDLDWRMHCSFPKRNSFYGLQESLEDLFARFFYCTDHYTKKRGICYQDYHKPLSAEEAAGLMQERHAVVD